jgi:small subunit ribosomal protein S19e
MRCASLLRKIYLHGPLGLSDLRSSYGGGVSIGYAPRRHRDSGGSAIRKSVQQLESGGLVTKHGNKGRILTSKGRSLLDKISMEVYKESLKINQETS